MHEPLYAQALRKSWDLTWHHKWIWIPGLFASFLGQMGLMDLFGKIGLAASDYALYPNWLAMPRLFKRAFLSSNFSLPLDGWIWAICLLIILVGFVIMFLYMAVVSQGAIIRSAAQFAKKDTLPSLTDAWKCGMKNFWSLLVVNFIKKFVLVVLAVMVGWGTLSVLGYATIGSSLLFLLLFILAVVVGMVLSFLVVYAAGYIVVEDYGVIQAFSSAWELFIKHWLVSVEVGLVVLLLNVLIGFISLLGFTVFLLPAAIVGFIASFSGNYTLWMAGYIVGFIFFVVYIIFIGSVFTVYTTSVWTYLFSKMHHEGIKSRIVHILTWKKGE